MSTAICSREECPRTVYARQLCASHYQKARIAGELPPSSANGQPCLHCGQPLANRSYETAKFCGRQCKDAHHAAANRDKALARKAGRACTECSVPIPPTVTAKAKTCSRECGVVYQNRVRQEAKRAAWEAKKPPCARCGGEIPTERHAGSKYCSFSCKHLTMADRYRERTPGYMRQRAYGITPEQFAEKLAAQDGRCAVCRADQPGGKGGWHVDHCHTSGRIRGLLCHHCNVGLGNFKDNVENLRAAIAYLERHASVEVVAVP